MTGAVVVVRGSEREPAARGSALLHRKGGAEHRGGGVGRW